LGAYLSEQFRGAQGDSDLAFGCRRETKGSSLQPLEFRIALPSY
jgi:hypothetical protein